METKLLNINRKNNFDFLRFLFAFSVLIEHFRVLSGHTVHWPIPGYLAVDSFFIISGFLISNSFYNSKSIKQYFIKRAKRILPAYIFVVIGAAVGLVFISADTIEKYFLSNTFWTYLIFNLGFLNFLQPELPNVFQNSNLQVVNASLWTIKIEIIFYISVPLIAMFLKKVKNKNILLIGCYIVFFIFLIIIWYLYETTNNSIYAIIHGQFLGQFQFFITGMFLFFNFDKFEKIKRFITPISFGILFVTTLNDNLLFSFVYPIVLGIACLGIAFSFPKMNNFARFGDFSYGTYLFHFPVIQIIIELINIHWLWQLATIIVVTIILAIFSWHFIEKRVLLNKI